MFDLSNLGTPETTIRLQTRNGADIKNAQAAGPDFRAREDYRRLRSARTAWVPRKAPSGGYNCFGLLWASRRTSIYDDDQVDLILRDDGYRRTDASRAVVGDIVLYRSSLNTLLHGGLIVRIEFVGKQAVLFVLSKWNDCYGEDIHQSLDVPWEDFTCEVWTDREEDKSGPH